ncbi:hypothetical protein KUTeg_012859 [Tegillarca granosa]|uniref:DUF4485 domain-containing protein n=1 Tax=Tegillarca granosa TaxID=220873 RepID=A0ABQ9ES42_TEGGR|nr:hypothetical protein KUTeg_012859 [Tegillarca granosa]
MATSGYTDDPVKNRNAYAQLMLHMLKRGVLEGPFTSKPQDGSLPTLPPYMDKVPDWVAGELTTSVGSSLFKSSIGNPAASSTWKSGLSPIGRERSPARRYTTKSMIPVRSHPHTSLGLDFDKEHGTTSPIRGLDQPDMGLTSYDDLSIGLKKPKSGFSLLDDEDFKKFRETNKKKKDDADDKYHKGTDDDLSQPSPPYTTTGAHNLFGVSSSSSAATTTGLFDDYTRDAGKDTIQMKTKMLEARFHEEKLRLQQKHDSAVQKMNDLVSDFEQQKFEMQKHHTKNIQEILDDTNSRLQKMEKEYSEQTNATNAVIKELESRVQQLMSDSDLNAKARTMLEKDKIESTNKIERLTADYEDLKERHASLEKEHQRTQETYQQELRTLTNKTEASLEFMKQEHNIMSSKAADTISELEQTIEQLKKSLKDSDEQRQRQIRELEQIQQQDKIHMENLHDKQMRALKLEMEQVDQDYQKKIKKLEQTIIEKEDEVKNLKDQNTKQAQQAEKSLEDFKQKVEKNQTQMYDEMKQQMERVEADLNKSKQVREKQAKEFKTQIDEERAKHERTVVELKMQSDAEKQQMIKDFHLQKEMVLSEHDREVENLKESHRNDIYDLECRMQERQEKDAKITKLKSQAEQQRLELQKSHSTELEKMLEKTNARLKEIEKEYNERGQKSTEGLQRELDAQQSKVRVLERKLDKQEADHEEKVTHLKLSFEERMRGLMPSSVRQELEDTIDSLKSQVHSLQQKTALLQEELDVKNQYPLGPFGSSSPIKAV